jgi:hypothetical protein
VYYIQAQHNDRIRRPDGRESLFIGLELMFDDKFVARHPEVPVSSVADQPWATHGASKTVHWAKQGFYLERWRENGAVKYAIREIHDTALTKPDWLARVRSVCESPFPGERGRVIYAAGFGAWGLWVSNTGWIYRGEFMREAREPFALKPKELTSLGTKQPAAPPVTDGVVELPKSSKDTWFRLAFEVTPPGCQAAAVFDVNDDNMQDIVVAGWHAYHILLGHLDGNRDLHFASDTRHVEPVAADVDRRGGKIAALGLHDLNHDGRLDLYLCRSALGGGTRGADDPLLNFAAGRFKRVDLGIASLGVIRSALFSDFDGDGHFDIYYTCSPYGDRQPNQLHAGTERWDRFGPDIFRETLVNPSACFDEKGRANKGFKGAIIRDLDGDGKPDIVTGAVADTGMVKSQAGWERGLFIFHNVSSPGRIRFEEVANTAVERAHSDGTQYPQMHVYSVIVADMDHDGDLDLFVTGSRSSFAQRSVQDKTPVVRLLRNDSTPGRIQFTDITKEAHLDFMNDDRLLEIYKRDKKHVAPNLAAGAAMDLDNDGHVDFVLVNRTDGGGDVGYASWVFRNDGRGRFRFVDATASGITRVARDLSFGDLNNDGRLDLVFVNGLDTAASNLAMGAKQKTNSVFLNQIWNDHHWIKVNVTGPENPFGIESKVTVFKTGTKEILGYDEVRTDFCYRSKKSPTLHFGLGPETTVDVLVKTRSGAEQWFKNLKANQSHTLTIGKP